MLTHGDRDAAFWIEKLVIVLFVLLTVPVGTQMLVRGAVARGIPQSERTQGAPIARPVERLEDIERDAQDSE